MQRQLNKHLSKLPSERGKGIAGTSLIHIGIFIILLIVGFTAPSPPESEKGILVNFGTDETGSGLIEPSPPASKEEATTPSQASKEEATMPSPVPAVKKPQGENPLLTQNIDKEAPAIKKVDPEAEKKVMEKKEADRKRSEALKAERAKKIMEETERKRVEAEQKRLNDIMSRTKNALANSKNSGTDSKGEGITGGPGNQGVTSGSVDSKIRGTGSGTGDKGISYDLQGRRFKTLPPPRYDYQGDGVVVVEVSVDRSGKVIQARPGAKGSSTLDEYLLKVAKEAALKATFDPKADAPVVQKGTISYNFILK